MKTHVIWLCVCIVAATIGIIVAPGKTVEVEKIVTKEVPKEIIKEVPREIIKEVPREIIKKVQATIPLEYLLAKSTVNAIERAKVINDKASLKTVKTCTASVVIMDDSGAFNLTIKGELQTKLELELRRCGIKVLSPTEASDTNIMILIQTCWNNNQTICSYTITMTASSIGFFAKEGNWDMQSVTRWERNYFGLGTKANLSKAASEGGINLINNFLNDYLEATQK